MARMIFCNIAYKVFYREQSERDAVIGWGSHAEKRKRRNATVPVCQTAFRCPPDSHQTGSPGRRNRRPGARFVERRHPQAHPLNVGSQRTRRLRQPLDQLLGGVAAESAVFQDWRSLPDNELLAVAERSGFATLVTTDKRIAKEQPQAPIAIVAVDDNSVGGLVASAATIANAIRSTLPGESRLVRVAWVRR